MVRLRRGWLLLAIALAGWICVFGIAWVVTTIWSTLDSPVPSVADHRRLPNLRATLYYTALESDYPIGNDAVFRDVDGRDIRGGSSMFHRAASIEGSARFLDGTVLNYHRRVDGEVRWVRVPSELGVDARGCMLRPFRTAAVDPDMIPLGTVMMIPETEGMPLPDGTVHDGVWIAGDTGDSIKGDRIDLYLGPGMDSMDVPRTFGIGHLQALTVWDAGTSHTC